MKTKFRRADNELMDVADSPWDAMSRTQTPNAFSSSDRCVSLPLQPVTSSLDTPKYLDSLLTKFAENVHASATATLKIGLLEKSILILRDQFSELKNQRSIIVAVNTLSPESLSLKQPILVTVSEQDDEFSATFIDGNIHATGDTRFEAVENLKDMMISKYRLFSSLGESKLGPGPRKQLAVLKSLIN